MQDIHCVCLPQRISQLPSFSPGTFICVDSWNNYHTFVGEYDVSTVAFLQYECFVYMPF